MINENISCCFTGYRPEKFPFPLSRDNADFVRFENGLIKTVCSLCDNGCYTFYSGMAMGFDIVAAECVLLARELYGKAGIRLICAIPFIEQSKNFPAKWLERYNTIISAADETILISDKYYRGCYDKRNKFMVDNSDYVVTWFDGHAGGTKNTVNYAKKSGRAVINLNDEADGTPHKEYVIME